MFAGSIPLVPVFTAFFTSELRTVSSESDQDIGHIGLFAHAAHNEIFGVRRVHVGKTYMYSARANVEQFKHHFHM